MSVKIPGLMTLDNNITRVDMSIQPFSDLGALFVNQSKEIWQRLGYVRDSYKSRGVLGPVRLGEETITDLW